MIHRFLVPKWKSNILVIESWTERILGSVDPMRIRSMRKRSKFGAHVVYLGKVICHSSESIFSRLHDQPTSRRRIGEHSPLGHHLHLCGRSQGFLASPPSEEPHERATPAYHQPASESLLAFWGTKWCKVEHLGDGLYYRYLSSRGRLTLIGKV